MFETVMLSLKANDDNFHRQVSLSKKNNLKKRSLSTKIVIVGMERKQTGLSPTLHLLLCLSLSL